MARDAKDHLLVSLGKKIADSMTLAEIGQRLLPLSKIRDLDLAYALDYDLRTLRSFTSYLETHTNLLQFERSLHLLASIPAEESGKSDMPAAAVGVLDTIADLSHALSVYLEEIDELKDSGLPDLQRFVDGTLFNPVVTLEKAGIDVMTTDLPSAGLRRHVLVDRKKGSSKGVLLTLDVYDSFFACYWDSDVPMGWAIGALDEAAANVRGEEPLQLTVVSGSGSERYRISGAGIEHDTGGLQGDMVLLRLDLERTSFVIEILRSHDPPFRVGVMAELRNIEVAAALHRETRRASINNLVENILWKEVSSLLPSSL